MSKRCGLGFDCAAMLQSPGLSSSDCPNYRTCAVGGSSPDEQLEFVCGENRETIRLTRSEAAITMLKSRGCSQNLDSLEINNLVSGIQFAFEVVKGRLGQFEDAYIAPLVQRFTLTVSNVGRKFICTINWQREKGFLGQPKE